MDSLTNVYVADTGNFTIRRITPDGTLVAFTDVENKMWSCRVLAASGGPSRIVLENCGVRNWAADSRRLVVSVAGGETGFIDRIAAYDALPERLKQRIEGLRVIHHYLADATKARFGERPEKCLQLSRNITLALEHPAVQNPVTHPLVYTQAETGRKVINVSPWHAVAIEGMENAEGDALLSEVIDLMIRPELAYFHKWEVDDMVLWDNWRMLHCARGVPRGEQRKMRRTTIAGDYALGGRLLSADANA